MSSLRNNSTAASGQQKRQLSPDYVDESDDNYDVVPEPSTKMPKNEAKWKVNESGEAIFELSDKRRVTIRKFKGKILVDIREYWETKEGEMAPGKKGISLNEEQWQSLKSVIGKIDEAITETK